jgi:hypothetical protein
MNLRAIIVSPRRSERSPSLLALHPSPRGRETSGGKSGVGHRRHRAARSTGTVIVRPTHAQLQDDTAVCVCGQSRANCKQDSSRASLASASTMSVKPQQTRNLVDGPSRSRATIAVSRQHHRAALGMRARWASALGTTTCHFCAHPPRCDRRRCREPPGTEQRQVIGSGARRNVLVPAVGLDTADAKPSLGGRPPQRRGLAQRSMLSRSA